MKALSIFIEVSLNDLIDNKPYTFRSKQLEHMRDQKSMLLILISLLPESEQRIYFSLF